MCPHSFAVVFLKICVACLEFVASPGGGRAIGRDILSRIGLRGGRGE